MALMGKAPVGFHTVVEIRAKLRNGRMFQRAWDVDAALAPAYHKALRWLQEELRDERVPGFMKLERIQVEVFYEKGEFTPEG